MSRSLYTLSYFLGSCPSQSNAASTTSIDFNRGIFDTSIACDIVRPILEYRPWPTHGQLLDTYCFYSYLLPARHYSREAFSVNSYFRTRQSARAPVTPCLLHWALVQTGGSQQGCQTSTIAKHPIQAGGHPSFSPGECKRARYHRLACTSSRPGRSSD